MATPRDLDPKFKEEKNVDVTPETEPEQKEDVPMIVFRQPLVVDGVATEKLHGPMPVSEWAHYEKENKL